MNVNMLLAKYSSTGGMHRFKQGHHGASHSVGAMIGYIQEETAAIWGERIAGWIKTLAETSQSGWTNKDLLVPERSDTNLKLTIFRSVHERQHGLPEIELRHLWICMN